MLEYDAVANLICLPNLALIKILNPICGDFSD